MNKIFDTKYAWRVERAREKFLEKYTVYSSEGDILYAVSKDTEYKAVVYRGTNVAPVIKEPKEKDDKYPFYKSDASESFDYLSRYYNNNKQAPIPVIMPKIMPRPSYAVTIPIKKLCPKSNLKNAQKVTIAHPKKITSQKAYRIYQKGECCLELYIDDSSEKYTVFGNKSPLYSVTQSTQKGKPFYSDRIIKRIDNSSFYRNGAQKNYDYFKLRFTRCMHQRQWSNPDKQCAVKIIEIDKNYISQIFVNHKRCVHRVVQRSTIVNNKKTAGYVIKEQFTPGFNYGNGTNNQL